MIKSDRHIEIMRSTVLELSSLSQNSCAAIYALLKEHYTNVGVTTVNNLADLMALTAKQPDLVFIGMKYVPNGDQKVWVSKYLEDRNIAHTGSPKVAIEFEQDKPLAKQHVLDNGLATARYLTVPHGQIPAAASLDLRFPVFIKPASLGGGSGVDDMSIAHGYPALVAKLALLSEESGADALIEEYLPGREFSVAVLKDDASSELMVMPIEMKPGADRNGDRILSLALKKGALETPVTPVPVGLLRDQLVNLARSVFAALGARDYGRIDIKLDAAGQPHFLEANLIPCLIRGSGNFPKACMINQSIGYEEMILRIVELGLCRNRKQQSNTYPKLPGFGKITQYLPS
jgi:D-alanine-D-alanine ligase